MPPKECLQCLQPYISKHVSPFRRKQSKFCSLKCLWKYNYGKKMPIKDYPLTEFELIKFEAVLDKLIYQLYGRS